MPPRRRDANLPAVLPPEPPEELTPLQILQASFAKARPAHLWRPGQSGNPAGRPKGAKGHLAELKRNLEIAVRDNLNPAAVKDILSTMVGMALAGDVKAAKLVLDKVLTNASEAEEQGDGGGTFVFQVKNLTLKHDANIPVVTNIIDITPEEATMSTGASPSNQSRTQDTSGGNLVGKAPTAPVRKVPDFQGKSGQSDNQSTNRGPGGK
jgi:hypothetical protein